MNFLAVLIILVILVFIFLKHKEKLMPFLKGFSTSKNNQISLSKKDVLHKRNEMLKTLYERRDYVQFQLDQETQKYKAQLTKIDIDIAVIKGKK